MPSKPRRPTVRDVAEAAGVSRSTVSRVLTGGTWTSPESRSAVEAAIRKTGYVVNPHARSLATSRANTVAFLLTATQNMLFHDPNFASLVHGAAGVLAEQGISFVLIIADTPAEQEVARRHILSGQVDGVLVAYSSGERQPLIRQLVEAGIPLVSHGSPYGLDGPIGIVQADDEAGATRMVRHLVESGRHSVATIAGPLDTSSGHARLAGYRRVVGDGADDGLVVEGDYTREGGARAARTLLESGIRFDALFAANDAMAAGAVETLRGAGLRVPEDVAVGGFDDSEFALSVEPAITTIRQPFERISAEMVRVLRTMIDGQGPSRITLPTEFVQRDSA